MRPDDDAPGRDASIGASGPDDPDALLQLATALAREAGTLALAGRRGSVLERNTKSSTTDLVTAVRPRRRVADRRPPASPNGRTTRSSARRAPRATARAGTRGSSIRSTARRTSCTTCRRGARRSPSRTTAHRRRGGLRARRRRAVRRPARRRGHARRHARSAAAARPTSRWRWSPPASATTPAVRAAQAATVARMIAEIRDIRRIGLGGDRPVLRGRRAGRRLLRGAPQLLGRRRRRADRPRGGVHHERLRRRAGRPVQHRRRRARHPRGAGRPDQAQPQSETARIPSMVAEMPADSAIMGPWVHASWPSRTTSASARRSSSPSRTRAGRSTRPSSGEEAIDLFARQRARRRADRHHAARHRRVRAVPHAAQARATCRS